MNNFLYLCKQLSISYQESVIIESVFKSEKRIEIIYG